MREAEAIYAAKKAVYQAQATVTRAIIATINNAIPKAFCHRMNTAGAAVIDSAAYLSNQDPRDILQSLCSTYGIPLPTKRYANKAMEYRQAHQDVF
jgi:hypothetical protein